jgi:hypothetical protein
MEQERSDNALDCLQSLKSILKEIFFMLYKIDFFSIPNFIIFYAPHPLNRSSILTTIYILLYFIQLTSSLSFLSQLQSSSFILTSVLHII